MDEIHFTGVLAGNGLLERLNAGGENSRIAGGFRLIPDADVGDGQLRGAQLLLNLQQGVLGVAVRAVGRGEIRIGKKIRGQAEADTAGKEI